MRKARVVPLILILIVLVAATGVAREIEVDLNNINYQVSAKAVGLKLDMESGEVSIKTTTSNYSDTTNLQGEMDYTAIATAGELTQLAKDVDGVFDAATKLDNGKFAVKFKGKGKRVFKQLLLQNAKKGKVTVLVEGDAEGELIVIIPGQGQKKKPGLGDMSQWDWTVAQLKQKLGISDNKAWDIVHEYLLIRTRHALEHTPKTDDEGKARWFFWLYLLEPEFKGGVDNNTVIARFFHPKTKQPLGDLFVNVSVRDLEGDLGVVYASPMPYYSDKKLYVERLKESKHWLIPLEQLDPGEYMLHVDVGNDLRKYVKIPIIITSKGNIVEKNPNGEVDVSLHQENGEIQSIEVSFANSSEKTMKLSPVIRLTKNGKLVKNITLKSFSISPNEQLSNEVSLDAVLGGTLKSGEYTVKLLFQTSENKVITAEGKFTVSD